MWPWLITIHKHWLLTYVMDFCFDISDFFFDISKLRFRSDPCWSRPRAKWWRFKGIRREKFDRKNPAWKLVKTRAKGRKAADMNQAWLAFGCGGSNEAEIEVVGLEMRRFLSFVWLFPRLLLWNWRNDWIEKRTKRWSFHKLTEKVAKILFELYTLTINHKVYLIYWDKKDTLPLNYWN